MFFQIDQKKVRDIVDHRHLYDEVKLHNNYMCINEAGLKLVLDRCQKPNVFKMRDVMGFVTEYRFARKEIEIKSCLRQWSSTSHYSFQEEYPVGKKHRIDIYFYKQKLAVEVDENDHNDRDIDKELERERYIKRRLRCEFFRYNPDNKDDYSVFHFIGELTARLQQIDARNS